MLTVQPRKGVSFLSRFSIIGGKKKEQSDDIDDNASEPEDRRTEGMNAHVFSSSIGANGYIPSHKEPPKYITVRSHNKKERDFNRMFLAQELSGTRHKSDNEKVPGLTEAEVSSASSIKSVKAGGAVWTMEFSRDGRYLAAAGRDQVVRVWAVISTSDERHTHEHEEDASTSSGGQAERLSAPVFMSKPIREFEGHTSDVLDLSWSKNNFLLSSSMDKTVRLWHISRQECLCTFKHKDFVTAIAFHPRDDRFFLAGSLDSVLRLWSIPDKSVAYWNQLPDLITAVAFTPDGKGAIAGVLSGLCLFYDTEGLKYHTQIHVRSSRGRNAKGSKITGIRTMLYPPDDPEGEVKLLVTSNDSRVRLYNLRDKSLEMKFRGHENSCSQINASFSDDAKYIICGSEDRRAYIWSTAPAEADTKDKRPVEFFEAHSDIVTATIFAPTKTRQLLSGSGDPLYDLCNPPPVTLLSRAESNASKPLTMSENDKRLSDPMPDTPTNKKPEETPAYLARALHRDGNIIITADHSGSIKVFRQDCAYQKRRHDIWDTASTFSRKIGIGRSASIMTRGSNSSRRNSVSQSNAPPGPSSDRILAWQNSIASNTSLESGSRKFKADDRDRSNSPSKSVSGNNFPSQNLSNAALARQVHSNGGSGLVNERASHIATSRTSPPVSVHTSLSHSNSGNNIAATVSHPPTPSFSLNSASVTPGSFEEETEDANPLRLQGGKSYQFWNPQTWLDLSRDTARSGGGSDGSGSGSVKGASSLKPPGFKRGNSMVSKLSSDDGSALGSGEGESEGEGEVVVCGECGGRDFRGRRVGGRQMLVCTRCGTSAE